MQVLILITSSWIYLVKSSMFAAIMVKAFLPSRQFKYHAIFRQLVILFCIKTCVTSQLHVLHYSVCFVFPSL